MAYIVKSSLDIGGKIVPFNEQEIQKLITKKEKIVEEKNNNKSEIFKKEVKENEKENEKDNKILNKKAKTKVGVE